MAIDERFSVKRFLSLEPNRPEQTALLEDLQREIKAAISGPAESAFNQVVEQLRSLRHNLVADHPDDPPTDVSLDFYDVGVGRSSDDHQLHIHLDVVLTVAWNYKPESS